MDQVWTFLAVVLGAVVTIVTTTVVNRHELSRQQRVHMHLDLLPMLVAEADLLSKHNDRTPLNTTSLLALGADVERVGILLSRQERKQARLINASVRDAEWLQPDRHLGLGGGGGYANPSGLEAEEEMRVKYRSIVGETEALEQIVADKLERPARAGLKPVLKALPGR